MEAVSLWKATAENRAGKKSREAKGGKAGEEGGARAVFPDVAAVAWLSAALKITAFTLQLKNSCSDHLFRRKSSSSIVFPRLLQPPRHTADTPRVSRFLPLQLDVWNSLFLVYFALGLTPLESCCLFFMPGRPSLTRPLLLHRQNSTLTASKTQMFPSILGMIYQVIPSLQIKFYKSNGRPVNSGPNYQQHIFGILLCVGVLYNSIFLNFIGTTQSFSLLHWREYNIVS